jgi:succinate dehydrogenase hydrophobic anchor subunit
MMSNCHIQFYKKRLNKKDQSHLILKRKRWIPMKAHRKTLGHWLLQRMTTTFLIPTIFLLNVSTLIMLNISLLWHIHVGIKEILTNYAHHEMTQNWILILHKVCCLIIIKYVSFFFIFKNNLWSTQKKRRKRRNKNI